MCPFNGTSPAMTQLGEFLRSKHIYNFTAGNLLHCNPPLIINRKQLAEVFAVIDEGLKITDQHYKE